MFTSPLKPSLIKKLHTYTRDYEELEIAKNLEPGHIIISTNLAGRGTDITLSDELIEAGGLHVCLSFLPNNSRIEEQAYGRAARNGNPGTAQLIFKNTCPNYASKIIDIKKQRDTNELNRISDIKSYYEKQIVPEEKLFEKCKVLYDQIKNLTQSKEVKSILLKSCLDQWAYFLDRNSKCIASVRIEPFVNDMLQIVKEEFKTWSNLVKDPSYLIQLGLFYLKKEKDYETSILLFNRVIEEEPLFCESAFYYRICAESAGKDLDKQELFGDFEIVEKLLKQRMLSTFLSAHSIDLLKERNTRSILHIDSFKEQQININRIHNTFLTSIYNVLGHNVSPDIFLLPTKIDKETSNRVYDDLVEENVITRPQVKDNVTESDMAFVLAYGISPKRMCEVLKKYVGNKYDEQSITKAVGKDLPSRELFWDNLVEMGVLINEEKYALLDPQELNNLDPSLNKVIEKSTVKIPCYSDQIWMYPEEIKRLVENSDWKIFKRKVLKKKIGIQKYKLFKKRGVVIVNKLAGVLNPLPTVCLDKFDSIRIEDFKTLGIADAIAFRILDELDNKKVIGKRISGNKLRYSLLIDPDNIGSIELSAYKAYSDDVKSLLSVCFAFRIALHNLKYLLEDQTRDGENLCLPLPSKLHKKIISELHEHEIVKAVVNPENDGVKVLQKYSKSIDREGYAKIFSDLYDIEKSQSIIDELIEKNWLITDFNLVSLNKTYFISSEEQEKLPELCPQLIQETATIKLILNQTNIICSEINHFEKILESHKCGLNKVNTPSFSLKPLTNVLQEQNVPASELPLFSLNGFDQVLVLEEKKWTWAMKINAFFVAMLGLTELAAGAALTLFLCQPIGAMLLAEGTSDLIYATQSMYSGHFTWKDYSLNKLLNLTMKVLSSINSLRSIFKTKFGEITKMFSYKFLKQKCLDTYGEASSFMETMFGVSKPVDNAMVMKAVVKRVAVNAAQGIAFGVASASIDNCIQPKLEKLGEAISNTILAEIDDTINSHSISNSVNQLFRRFEIEETKKIVNLYTYITVLECYKTENDTKWKIMSNACEVAFHNIISNFIQQPRSKILASEAELFMLIFTICNKLVTVAQCGHSYFSQIRTMVSDILDKVDMLLQEKLEGEERSEHSQLGKVDLDRCTLDTLDTWSKNIKRGLTDIINYNIISPLLHSTMNGIMTYSSHIMANRYCRFYTDEEINEINKFKNRYQLTTKENLSQQLETPSFVDSEYDECLLEMLKKRGNATVFLDVLKKNKLVDMNWVKLCCIVIPKVLEKEGIHVPGLEIIVERGGLQQKFSTAKEGEEVTTVIIAPEMDLLTNIKKNNILIKDVFSALCRSLVQSHPELQGLTADTLRTLVGNHEGVKEFLNKYLSEESNQLPQQEPRKPTSKLNNMAEMRKPYQHVHFDGYWGFNSTLDVDLRQLEKLSYLNQVEDHLMEGYKTALEKINNHIYKVQDHIKPPFKISVENFSDIKYKIGPQSCKAKGSMFHCYPVHYKLVIPFIVRNNDIEDFSVTMSLNHQCGKAWPRCPHGPHIVYEIKPSNIKSLSIGVRGHVLLNEECEDVSYTAKDCLVAGDLLVTAPKPKQKVKKRRYGPTGINLRKQLDHIKAFNNK